MTAPSYRVQENGQFADLTPALKGQLLDGTFTYTPSLTRFTLRYLLEVEDDSAAEADAAALVEGELLAADFLESSGLTHKPLNISAVCLRDVKLQRRR